MKKEQQNFIQNKKIKFIFFEKKGTHKNDKNKLFNKRFILTIQNVQQQK